MFLDLHRDRTVDPAQLSGLQFFAKGGFALVLRAQLATPGGQLPVALKVLKPELHLRSQVGPDTLAATEINRTSVTLTPFLGANRVVRRVEHRRCRCSRGCLTLSQHQDRTGSFLHGATTS
jgi:hypothetical protein